MGNFQFKILLIFVLSLALPIRGQDTLVDIGGYNLHFIIVKGDGIPILFEAGGGNDASVWNGILDKIHEVTGTTLITYCRLP
ncbi:hypothetical protein [Maribacter sp. 4G9]|uniref:hypothetical protein n=1 Tax=Maribacter sp. 4G9 TaxID=1889777 RepID=UPI000C14B582|nr:hypothetical protein [Maribacter sp. 4G9]PIB28028.1 hypothetical protein BFP75_06130 [Maribacter sp. 4G9]